MTERKTSDSRKKPQAKNETEVVDFHYIKSNSFRVIYAHGAMGSITPSGEIYFSLYNERAAMPRRITHEVTKDNQLGAILESEGRTGYVRELEAGVILTAENATSLRDWLTERIGEINRLKAKKAKG